MVTKIAIGKPKQRPLSIAQMIDSVGGTWLRDTIAAASAWPKIELKGFVGSVLVSMKVEFAGVTGS